jgi:DNA-directed RNA polymerase subunit RPC12/RpoP
MAATIKIVCPECGKEIKAPPEFAGKKVRCKFCNHVFHAKAATPSGVVARSTGTKPAAPKPPVDDDEGDGNPYQVTGVDNALRCPECANEMESEDAIICLHCGYNTVTRERAKLKKVHDTTGADWVSHLAPGVACVLAIFGLIIFDVIYCVSVQPVKDNITMTFLGSNGVKMWICIVSIFFMFLCGKFAIKRLILNPVPPEVERH